MRRLMIAGVLLVVPVVACLVNFNPDGQPCGADGGCLTSPIRYVCQEGICKQAGSSGATSGGSTSGHATGSTGTSTSGTSSSGSSRSSGSSSSGSSGAAGCSPGCLANQLCEETTHQCVARNCTNLICPFLEECATPDGGAQCLPRADAGPAATNAACAIDADCRTQGYFCLHALHAGPGAPTGLCTKMCETTTSCVGTDVCDTNFSPGRGGFAGLCLSPTAATPATCTGDTSCRNSGLACSYFDDIGQPTLPNLPVAFCDASDAGSGGHPCELPTDCQSGVCAGAADAGLCYAPCATNQDCPGTDLCELVTPRGATGNAKACVPAPATRCAHCTSSATCSADAPVCDSINSTCNLACSAGENLPCGLNTSCGANGLCSFDAGACH